MSAKSPIANRKSPIQPQTLRALHAQWHKARAALDLPAAITDERDQRLYYTNARIGKTHGRSVNSWNELSEGQARYILKMLREESGDGAAFRARTIAMLACELWGGQQWDDFLRTRLGERYHVRDPRDLSPAQAHALIEELADRVARRDGVSVEDVRRKISPLRGTAKDKG